MEKERRKIIGEGKYIFCGGEKQGKIRRKIYFLENKENIGRTKTYFLRRKRKREKAKAEKEEKENTLDR